MQASSYVHYHLPTIFHAMPMSQELRQALVAFLSKRSAKHFLCSFTYIDRVSGVESYENKLELFKACLQLFDFSELCAEIVTAFSDRFYQENVGIPNWLYGWVKDSVLKCRHIHKYIIKYCSQCYQIDLEGCAEALSWSDDEQAENSDSDDSEGYFSN